MRQDWNLQRYKTRDLLLQYNILMLPHIPMIIALPTIYPWKR